ncbi:MAG: hypothetical protein KKI09_15390 [Spirochaetes bacterium]|nr:hypothetical protein [Spirochaetota bacterium]MBU0956804.1 hypothetical protein [Spirochaetota bacterium]
MKPFSMPKSLHDVFGERQTVFSLLLVLFGGVVFTLVFIFTLLRDPAYQPLPWYVLAPGLLLVFDIAAGCVANFSEGTSNYYARRPKNRWIFIAIHWHLPLCALLLGWPLLPVLGFGIYTLLAASMVNVRSGRSDQPLVAGLLLAVGLSALVIAGKVFAALSAPAMLVTVLFMIKVAYAFAVDHYRLGAAALSAGTGNDEA